MIEKQDLILVAGAGGFIGGHLVRALAHGGHRNIRAVDRKPLAGWYQRIEGVENIEADLRQSESCFRVTDGAAYVFDLAADMGGMGFIETHKADCMLSVLIGSQLLVASRDLGVKRFFFASSACVYNATKQEDPDSVPLKETDAYPALPEDGYGWEKLFMERLCRHFSEDFGLATRIARYHNVYGAMGTWNGGREKAPAAICRKVAEAKLAGRDQIEIWGDGEQSRSFMYIDDCIEGTRRIMESDWDQPINLGSSELVTVNGLVDSVERIAGIKLKRTYDLGAPTGVRGRNSDNSLIQEVLGWAPAIPLEEGLQHTYSWIYEQLVAGERDLQDVQTASAR